VPYRTAIRQLAVFVLCGIRPDNNSSAFFFQKMIANPCKTIIAESTPRCGKVRGNVPTPKDTCVVSPYFGWHKFVVYWKQFALVLQTLMTRMCANWVQNCLNLMGVIRKFRPKFLSAFLKILFLKKCKNRFVTESNDSYEWLTTPNSSQSL